MVVTGRELFKQFLCSERLYQGVFGPLLQVGLFAPAELCSAAATLGVLYYLTLAHQKHFDAVFYRETSRRFLSHGWSLKAKGCETLEDKKVSILNPSNACAGFDDLFFDLNIIHDEHKDGKSPD
ncbi:hypothetical protein POUND7_016742 [Theobroma cacao]